MNRLRAPFAARTLPEPNTGCLLWTGAMDSRGYGVFHQGGNTQRWRAHRLSWLLATGSDAGAMEVCHRCDVRLCVNPAHLFLGTRKDNAADAQRKGRFRNPSQSNRTHCSSGHEYTEATTRWVVRPPNYRKRVCLLCVKEYHRRSRAKKKADPVRREIIKAQQRVRYWQNPEKARATARKHYYAKAQKEAAA